MNPTSGNSSEPLYEKVILTEGGLLISFELDYYQHWTLRIRYIKGGLNFEDLFRKVVEKAEDGWLDNHFEDDDYEDCSFL